MIVINKTNGFTLVESILVIVVISLLVFVGVIGWSGVTTMARNTGRTTDVEQWISRFELYRSRNVVYPDMPTADGAPGAITRCLGSFTTNNNKCGQYNSATATAYIDATQSATMITEANKVGNAITDSGPAINNALVGPLVYMTQSTSGTNVTVTAQFINFFEGNCPNGYTNINSTLPTPIALVMTGLPSGTNANVCSKTQTFTYGP